MTVRDLLEKKKVSGISFVIAKAVKDEHTPYFHTEYKESRLYYVNELYSHRHIGISFGDHDTPDSEYLDYIVLNHKSHSIAWLTGVDWTASGNDCFLIVSEKDFETLYPYKEERERMVAFINKKIEKDLHNDTET